jgi:hypothetical protein
MDERTRQWLREKIWQCDSIEDIKSLLDDIICELPVEPEYNTENEK